MTEIDWKLTATMSWTSKVKVFAPAKELAERLIRTEHNLTVRMGFLTARLRVEAVNDGKNEVGWQIRQGLTVGARWDIL